MSNDAILNTAQLFLDEVWTGDPPTHAELAILLEKLLDHIPLDVRRSEPTNDSEPPDRDWKTLYAQTGQRFPSLGLYEVTNQLPNGKQEFLMGDAIDDIADITTDLRDAIWYAKNDSAAYALTFLSDMHFHWGEHARELLTHLNGNEAR